MTSERVIRFYDSVLFVLEDSPYTQALEGEAAFRYLAARHELLALIGVLRRG